MKLISKSDPTTRTLETENLTPVEFGRWEVEAFARPPHHYRSDFCVLDKAGNLRPPSVEEWERLLGFEADHSRMMVGSSFAKNQRKETAKRRSRALSIAGGPRMWTMILRHWLNDCGLVAQAGAIPDVSEERGFSEAEALLLQLWRGITHRGSDVRLTTGEPMRPSQFPRQSIDPRWWQWRTLVRAQWREHAHINELEARAALMALQWRCRAAKRFGKRWLILLDSFVSIGVLTKPRSTSYRLNRVVRKLAVLELASFTQTSFGFARSHLNPADYGSRL